jgi:hypothetical protein
VLEDLDQELDGGEDLGVGAKIVVVRSAIDHGVRASLFHEQILKRNYFDVSR